MSTTYDLKTLKQKSGSYTLLDLSNASNHYKPNTNYCHRVVQAICTNLMGDLDL